MIVRAFVVCTKKFELEKKEIILYYIILYYTEYADKDKDKEILNYNPLPSRGIIGVHFFKEKSNIIYQYTRFPS